MHARHRRRHHGFGRALRRGAVLAVVLVLLTAAAGAAAVAVFLHDPARLAGCHLSAEHARSLGQDSFLRAADGSRLGAVPAAWNRQPIPLARMGRWLPNATVAVEDRRFWRRRSAIDYESILRAAIADVRAGHAVQGGSTIAQQLVRDRYLHHPRPVLSRKIREACLAIELGQRMSKREILTAYLDEAFYGNRAYGVQAAARTYFSRSAGRLTLVQAALIAGLPQAPTLFDPLRHPAAARRRRDEVLAALRTAGAISRARAATAMRARLRLRPSRAYDAVHERPFFEPARLELAQRLGARRARSGGLDVTTTLDPRLQRLGQQALDAWLRLPTDPAGALVAIDPANGAVRALAVRSPGRLRFNLATQSRRQAGSTFKAFTLTAAVESGIALSSRWHGPSTLTIRDPRCRTGTQDWVVHNYADEASGTMTLGAAIAHSVNTIFAQVALKVGLPNVVDVAHRMGVESPLSPVCSLTLGPEGVSPLEMTDAFATLASHGIHHRPEMLARVRGPGGRTLIGSPARGDVAVARSAADQVTRALTGVISSGTGTAAALGRPAAGKTGTSQSFTDAWFCGFVPQLATCVWMGHAGGEVPMAAVDGFAQPVGGSVPARIWHAFMAAAVAPWPVRPLAGHG